MIYDEKIRQIRIEAGSKGGNPALKQLNKLDILDNQPEVNQKPTPSSSSSFSSSTSTTKKTKEKEVKEKEKPAPAESPSLILPKDIKPDVWKGFVEMRKKLKAPLTEKGSELILIELDKIGQDKNDVLSQSIRNSWRGVFELHTQGGFNGNRNERNNSRPGSRESSQKTTGSGHQGLFLQPGGEWPEDHREVAPCG